MARAGVIDWARAKARAREVMALVGLRAEGITPIMISHKLNEIRAIAEAIAIIRDGQSIEPCGSMPGWTRTASFAAWSAVPWARASRSGPRILARPSSRSGTGGGGSPDPRRGGTYADNIGLDFDLDLDRL